MMIELTKVDEIASRLRQYELDNKPRYFNVKYINKQYAEPQLIAERMSGEQEFRDRFEKAVNTYKADKVIFEEFNQKAKSIKEPVSVIEIGVEQPPEYTIVNAPAPTGKTKERETGQPRQQAQGQEQQQAGLLDALGGLDGIKQEVRNEMAKEYQLLKERDEKKQLVTENEQLKKDNRELEDDNTKLYGLNNELSEKVQDLQKYIPENLKIGNLSVTKILGSILGTATEAMVKNIVLKKPDKVRDIIGETAFEQLSGLVGGDGDEEPDPALDSSQMQAVQPIAGTQSGGASDNPVVNAIHQVNANLPPGQLAKVQIIYYHLLKDDETLDDGRLDGMVRFIRGNRETEPMDGNGTED